jgi:hypothetical protein
MRKKPAMREEARAPKEMRVATEPDMLVAPMRHDRATHDGDGDAGRAERSQQRRWEEVLHASLLPLGES